MPSTLKKSSSATPDVNVATLPLDIPEDGTSEVNATVPAEFGNVTVTSAVEAGPIKVTAFVPLSVSSLNKIEPAALEEPVRTGVVKLLFVNVCVPVSETKVASELPIVLPPGKVRVLVAASLCACGDKVCA